AQVPCSYPGLRRLQTPLAGWVFYLTSLTLSLSLSLSLSSSSLSLSLSLFPPSSPLFGGALIEFFSFLLSSLHSPFFHTFFFSHPSSFFSHSCSCFPLILPPFLRRRLRREYHWRD